MGANPGEMGPEGGGKAGMEEAGMRLHPTFKAEDAKYSFESPLFGYKTRYNLPKKSENSLKSVQNFKVLASTLNSSL